MRKVIYQILKKIYWKLPFSDNGKEIFIFEVRKKINFFFEKRKLSSNHGCEANFYVDYTKVITSIPKGKRAEYVADENCSFERDNNDPKLLAYYLTQFHPTRENDLWWGKGVTEWNNVARAVPQYKEHYQPRFPGELGYYDLRITENLKRQAELAAKYGIYGFVFYFYWFDGKRLLDLPLDKYVDEKIDFPFALCWANESWTKRFDGSSGEVLMEQRSDVDSYRKFIDSVVPYMKSKKYIRIEGKLLLNIYRPSLIPDCAATIEYWRERCRELGVGEIYLIGVREHTWDRDLIKLGFDAQNEFHPGTIFKYCVDITNDFKFAREDFMGRVYDYKDIVVNKKYFNLQAPKLYRAVMPMWDNTARRDNKGMIFQNASPELYKNWLSDILKECSSKNDTEDKLVFINAWNEWGEGAYLEPDRDYGYAYLKATKDALEGIKK